MSWTAKAVLATCLVFAIHAAGLTELQTELLELQRTSPDGVVRLSSTSFERYAAGKSRPYSLILLFMAESLIDKPKLGLRSLRKEFGLASKAYREKYTAGTERAGKVFFVMIELEDGKDVFQRFSVDSLPFVFRLAPHIPIKKSGPIEAPDAEKMTFERYPDYPWKAEAFADFVKVKTGIAVEEIPRSDFLSSRVSALFIVLFLASSVWSATRLYHSPIVQSKWIWMVGSVLVCWFATSGGMFNIIRGMPFAIPKDGKIQLLYPGNGQQLGAEGYIAGTMYILFSGAILVMAYGPAMIQNPTSRRIISLGALICAMVFLRQIVSFYHAKTGYPIQQYIMSNF